MLPSASRAGAVAVLVLAFVMGAPSLTSESYVSLHGDPPKHLMNGVFLADLMRDRPFGSLDALEEYAELYFARYPALSLGHHPPLLPALEAPVFATLGVSVASARIVQLASFMSAALLLYLLVGERVGWTAGVLAAGVFATSPTVVVLGQSAMTEVPALALVLGAAYSAHRFTRTESRLSLAAFVATAVLSLYAKQLAIFVFPAYLVIAVASLGVRRLFRRDVLTAACIIVVATLPLIVMTLVLSPANVRATVSTWTGGRASVEPLGPFQPMVTALTDSFTWSSLVLIAVGIAGSVIRPGRPAIVFVVWAVTALAALVVAPWEPARYGVYAVPALAAVAGSLAAGWRTRVPAAIASLLLIAAVGHQAVEARQRRLPGAAGYEEAARFVTASEPGPAVLFSGDVDTGYFIFFVRKHDPSRSLVVLRADKTLTTSAMGNPAARNRINERSEIYAQLQQFGVRYIVIEDRPSQSAVLEWLREELRSARFAERLRIRIESDDARLAGTDLAIFEYLHAGPPDRHAVLSMDLRVIRRRVSVPLTDLIDRKYFR